jgi:hypothetical protein
MSLLGQLAIILVAVAAAAILGERLRFSAIPLFMLAGILLGPYEPFPSAIVEGAPLYLISELGIILLLFYLGLEFSLDRITQAWKLVARGGVIDLIINGGLGFLVGVALFGAGFAVIRTLSCYTAPDRFLTSHHADGPDSRPGRARSSRRERVTPSRTAGTWARGQSRGAGGETTLHALDGAAMVSG